MSKILISFASFPNLAGKGARIRLKSIKSKMTKIFLSKSAAGAFTKIVSSALVGQKNHRGRWNLFPHPPRCRGWTTGTDGKERRLLHKIEISAKTKHC